MNEENNLLKSYEDFFEEVWDYIPYNIVSDDMWDKHISKFQELTFELYHFYKNTVLTLPNGDKIILVSTKVYARIIEAFVKNFNEELVK